MVLHEPAPIPVVPDEPPAPIVDVASPEPTVEEGPPIDPVDFREQEEVAPLSDAFARDDVPALAAAEPPQPEAWADEPAVFSTTPDVAASPPEGEPVVATEDEIAPLLPPPEPAESEKAWDPEPSQWSDAVQPTAVGVPRTVQALADDPIPRQGYAAEREYSDEHFSHGASPSYTSSPRSSAREDGYTYSLSEPGFEEEQPDGDDYRKPRPIVLDERFVHVASVVGVVLSKSLAVLERVSRDLWRALRKAWVARAAKRPAPIAQETPREELRTSFVNREEPEPPAVSALADEPSVSRFDEPSSRPTPIDDLPIVPLKAPDAEGSIMIRVQKSVQLAGAGLTAWAASLRGRVEDLVRRKRPTTISTSPVPWNEPAPRSTATSVGYEPAREPVREPVRPPPSTPEIPVLRLAKIDDEPVEQEDIYDGPSESAYFPTAWLWTKRLAWTALFAVGAFLVYENWAAWSPKAKSISSTAFTEVTRFAENRELRVREQQALQAATEQLPHLTPDVLRLVVTRSTSGVPPDPPEVFQVTCNAADRGLQALTPEEREELSTLRAAVLEAISPAERILLREYDAVRSRRPSFAFEDKSALALFARGARGLPVESLERFKVLLGKAVVAGLGAPASERTAATPAR
jgi:hypothetical protein